MGILDLVAQQLPVIHALKSEAMVYFQTEELQAISATMETQAAVMDEAALELLKITITARVVVHLVLMYAPLFVEMSIQLALKHAMMEIQYLVMDALLTEVLLNLIMIEMLWLSLLNDHLFEVMELSLTQKFVMTEISIVPMGEISTELKLIKDGSDMVVELAHQIHVKNEKVEQSLIIAKLSV